MRIRFNYFKKITNKKTLWIKLHREFLKIIKNKLNLLFGKSGSNLT